MPALIPTITNAGLQAAIDADDAGIQIYISHVSFGDGLYDPDGYETALVNQHVLLPIASGGQVGPTQLRLSAVWQEEDNVYNIGEIGYWVGSTLFAVWSRATGGYIAVKDAGIDFVAIYDLSLSAVPPNSVNITVNTEVNEALAVLAEHLVDPNAHPASAIMFSQARTVQEMNDCAKEIIDPEGSLLIGETNYLTYEGEHILPPVTGLAVGSRIRFVKKPSITPILAADGSNGEKILVGKSSGEQIPYDRIIYNINTGLELIFNGIDWELM